MKKLLISLLLICGVVLSCFSSAEDVEDLIVYNGTFSQVQVGSNYKTIIKLNGTHEIKSICVKFTNFQQGQNLSIGFSMQNNGTPGRMFNYANNGIYVCLDYYADGYLIGLGQSSNYLDGDVFVLNDLLTTPIPKLTSLQCQTEYNLIPISSVDQNYCTTNNLCPSVDCPEYPDNPNIGTSNIYINDIFHPGAFNVIINIPEEIDWDYAYTSSGSNFNLDVVGYNQDTEYINGLIDINNYKPTSDDFSRVFGLFSNYGGLLVACLFVILVFYFVKKLF